MPSKKNFSKYKEISVIQDWKIRHFSVPPCNLQAKCECKD